MGALTPLTPEEQEMAVKHLYLVDEFLRRKHLDTDEYYDVVIFGYLAAIQMNCRDKDYPEEKKNFHGLAEICMRNAVYSEWRYLGREKNKANRMSTSFDALMDLGEEEFSLYEIIEDTTINIENSIAAQDLIDCALAEDTPKERKAIEYTCLGFKPREIAEIMDTTPFAISCILYKFRKKVCAMAEGQKDIYNLQCKEKIREQNRTYYEA